MLVLVKKLKDNRYLFNRDGVHFTLTIEQVLELTELVNKLEEDSKK